MVGGIKHGTISPDFKSKKEFKAAFAAGRQIATYSPGIFPSVTDGTDTVEAPAHTTEWYSRVLVKDGYIIKILG